MKKNLRDTKDLLKFTLLNSKYHYDLSIYRILDNGCLDFALKEIDETPVLNTITQESITANEQVIRLLDRLLFILKREFIGTLPFQEVIVEDIIRANEDKMRDYLKLKCCLDHSESSSFVLKKIYEIIVINFYHNASFIAELKELFSSLSINSSKLEGKELIKIKDLLGDIVHCNQREYSSLYLFKNVHYSIYTQFHKKNNSFALEQIKEKIIGDFSFRYSLLLESYHEKKKYLKYLT